MIEVTRLNGTTVLINSDLIETVEETPDTVISLIYITKLIKYPPITLSYFLFQQSIFLQMVF